MSRKIDPAKELEETGMVPSGYRFTPHARTPWETITPGDDDADEQEPTGHDTSSNQSSDDTGDKESDEHS